MSNKYPSQDATKNIHANKTRQRYSHTIAYHTAHLQREMAEANEAKISAFRQADPEGYARRQKAKRERQATSGSASGTAGTAGTAGAAGASEGIGIIFAGAGVGAVATGAALAAVGGGTAYLLNRTILKDDPTLTQDERNSRSAGRVASYAGATVGTVGTIGAIGAAGSVVGLSSAGIASGVVAIGGTLGGGLLTGSCLVVAAPAVAAVAVGYGIYSFAKWLKS